jgi:hypothetical protein
MMCDVGFHSVEVGAHPWLSSSSMAQTNEQPRAQWPARSNKRMKLAIALAPAPRVNAKEGHFACPLFSGHRALAAYAWCSTDL